MTNGRRRFHMHPVAGGENRRSPFDYAQGRLSTSLRFGRDDNSYLGTGCECPREIVIPKKTQTLGMTKGRVAFPWREAARQKVFFIFPLGKTRRKGVSVTGGGNSRSLHFATLR